jgi:hypothetical protein
VSKESETIQKISKEIVISTCEGTWSWISLCLGDSSGGLGSKGWETSGSSIGIPCILCEWCGGSMLAEMKILWKKSMANYVNKHHSLVESRNQNQANKTFLFRSH